MVTEGRCGLCTEGYHTQRSALVLVGCGGLVGCVVEFGWV
jgi:hypothetical protein